MEDSIVYTRCTGVHDIRTYRNHNITGVGLTMFYTTGSITYPTFFKRRIYPYIQTLITVRPICA